MRATELKEHGFYWVKDSDDRWMVVEYDGKMLSMTQGECPWIPSETDDSDYIGPLTPPPND